MNIVGYIFFSIICFSIGLSSLDHPLYPIPMILGVLILVFGFIPLNENKEIKYHKQPITEYSNGDAHE